MKSNTRNPSPTTGRKAEGASEELRNWSPELKALTRSILLDLPFHCFLNGNCLHLKHEDGRYGTLSLGDAIAGRMRVRPKEGGQQVVYVSEEALVEDGWAVD